MKKLELNSAIGTFANVGVVIGILLLVFELYQNRLMMRAQARSEISDTLVQMLFEQSLNPEISEISRKARAGEELTLVEEEQFLGIQQAFWRYRENVSYQWRHGLFDDEEYEAQREVWVRNIDTSERVREIWCGRAEIQSPDFVAEINSLLENPC